LRGCMAVIQMRIVIKEAGASGSESLIGQSGI